MHGGGFGSLLIGIWCVDCNNWHVIWTLKKTVCVTQMVFKYDCRPEYRRSARLLRAIFAYLSTLSRSVFDHVKLRNPRRRVDSRSEKCTHAFSSEYALDRQPEEEERFCPPEHSNQNWGGIRSKRIVIKARQRDRRRLRQRRRQLQRDTYARTHAAVQRTLQQTSASAATTAAGAALQRRWRRRQQRVCFNVAPRFAATFVNARSQRAS